MDDSMIAQLEVAARIVMQPPNEISTDQRTNAEMVIMNLRKQPRPYAICREIFERSQCDLLLFEAADTLKRAVVNEFNLLETEDRTLLRQYLLNYIIQRDIPSFIRSKIIQVVAIMVKRTSVTDSGCERAHLVTETTQMVKFGDYRQKFIGCRILYTIMNEFLTTIKSDDTGLTFDEHFKAKKLFELSDLRKIFFTVLETCEQIIDTPDLTTNTESMELLTEYISICESCLVWGYVSPLLPKRLINALEMSNKIDQTPSLRLSLQWETIMLDPKLIEMFFKIYWTIRDVSTKLQPKALTCLVQLSTINGPVIDCQAKRLPYVTQYLTNFLQLITSRPVAQNEAYGISIIFRKILVYTPDQCLKQVPENLRNSTLLQMFVITCGFMEQATAGPEQFEDSVNMITLDNILEAWLLISRSFSETVQQYLLQMFNKYLQCHLSLDAQIACGATTGDSSTPTVCRPQSPSEDEIFGAYLDSDDEEMACDQYLEQLTVIGMFGREHLEHTLPTLCKLLEERTITLRDHFLRIYQLQNLQASDKKVLEIIYDDILWILYIAGHVLAMQSQGEEPIIPIEVRRFSLAQHNSGKTDLTATLKLLASPSMTVAEIPNADTQSDYVVRFVAAVFRLCDIENKAIELNMNTVLSPEVCKSIMWFLQMWSESYLLYTYPYEETELSDSLRMAFGSDRDGGKWTVNFILNKICMNVRHFSSEKHVVKMSSTLFVSLVKNRKKCPVIFGSEYFKQILELRNLEIKKNQLLHGLMLVATCVTPTDLQNQYLFEILSPIRDTYQKLEWRKQLINRNEFVLQKLCVRLAYNLDDITALVSGTTMAVVKGVYMTFQDIFMDLSEILNDLHDQPIIVESIMGLLCVVVERLRSPGHRISEICLRVIQTYVKLNSNRLSDQSITEEDIIEHLLLMLKLSNNFLTLGLFEPQDSENDGDEVCATIVQYIMPMITLDMLKYPHFCLTFYQTLKLFIEKSVGIIASDFTASIIKSIELGVHSFGIEVQSVSLECIHLLGASAYYDQNCESFLYNALIPILKQIFTMILLQEIDTDNRTECCRAFFTLLCVYRTRYTEIIDMLLQLPQVTDQQRRDQLNKEITDLARVDNLYNNRNSHLAFSSRFEKFLVNISQLA